MASIAWSVLVLSACRMRHRSSKLPSPDAGLIFSLTCCSVSCRLNTSISVRRNST